jgi:hypothetical protein
MDSGSGGSEPEVVNFSGACHKRFRTLAQAEAFIAYWVEMNACIVKAKIKVKTEGNDDEDELTDVFSMTRIE